MFPRPPDGPRGKQRAPPLLRQRVGFVPDDASDAGPAVADARVQGDPQPAAFLATGGEGARGCLGIASSSSTGRGPLPAR